MDDSLIHDAAGGFVRGIAANARTWLAAQRRRWQEVQRFRRELEYLMSLSERDLGDMGLTRHDLRESRRAGEFIRAADHE
jgi:uncharacterized protein YjiS (DUF1127 family)